MVKNLVLETNIDFTKQLTDYQIFKIIFLRFKFIQNIMRHTKGAFWSWINLDVPFMFEKYNSLNNNNDNNFFNNDLFLYL